MNAERAASHHTFPRYLAPRLREALGDTAAVLIHGPRQSGKTTLARAVGEPRGYRYVSFNDEAVRAAAKTDPVGFVKVFRRRPSSTRCSGYRSEVQPTTKASFSRH